MKSEGKKDKILSRIKKWYRNFMYEEETVKELEEEDKKPFIERFKNNLGKILYATALIIIAAVFWTIGAHNRAVEEEKIREEDRGSYITVEDERERKQFSKDKTYDYIEYVYDDNHYAISKVNLNEENAYSLSYKTDYTEGNEVTQTAYFTSGEVVTVLLNGYPNTSYKDMKLEDEEEAYIATQLAIYSLVSEKQYSMANGEFSLENVLATEDKYKEKVERIVVKAKELYQNALDNPYEPEYYGVFDNREATKAVRGRTAIFGPYYSKTHTDKYTEKFLGEKSKTLTEVEAKSFIINTNVEVVDSKGEKLTTIENGQAFYIKVDGAPRVFSEFKVSGHSNYLRSIIYSSEEDKKYVLLEAISLRYSGVEALIHNFDEGSVKINLHTDEDENINTISYNIYDEERTLIHNIDFTSNNLFTLPVGKYYIEVYDIPKGYFIEEKEKSFEIGKDEQTTVDIYIDMLK